MHPKEEKELSLISILYFFYAYYNRRKFRVVLYFLVIFGYFISNKFVSDKVYKADMIVSSPIVSSERIVLLTKPLNELAREKNYSRLASLLGLSIEEAKLVKGIDAEQVKNSKDEVPDAFAFQNCTIEARIQKDTALFKKLQSGFENYIRSNNFIKRKAKVNKENQEAMLTKLSDEIEDLNTLKAHIANGDLVTPINPSQPIENLRSFYEDLNELKIGYKLQDDGLNIISPFIIFQKPVAPRLSVNLLSAGILFLLVVVLEVSSYSIVKKFKALNQED